MSAEIVAYLSERDFRLSRVIETVGPLPDIKPNDPFVFLVHEIIGQMLSDKVRDVLINRFHTLCGEQITPSHVLDLEINRMSTCGISLRKCNSIKSLALAINAGTIDLGNLRDKTNEEVTSILTQIKGIGQWTSKMFLLFYLNRDDILPVEDAAFMQAFRWLYGYKNPSTKTVIRRCAKWRPYSSLASRYMYRALDTGLTKLPLQEFLGNL